MKNRFAIAISAVLLITAGAVFALARTGDPTGLDNIAAQAVSKEGHPFIRRMMNRIADRLDLSEEQRQQVKTILENERPTVEPLVRSLIATKQELREATSNGKFNEEQVRALADRQGQTMSQLIVEKERVKAQIYNILTPEQRAEAEKMRSRFEAKIHERLMK
ncbi:MAG: Spy/CpxP family protein refolding chaperone [Pyrinomonadaceae bacterium]|nr:Spy/CpxP family protein refolding chaperone [Pyrinomonadaceae bacterium]